MEYKNCAWCRDSLPLIDFHSDGRNGRKKYCKTCTKKIRDGEITKEELELRSYEERTQQYEEQEIQNIKDLLVASLLEISRHDLHRLKDITEKEFKHKTNCKETLLQHNISFESIKEDAKISLIKNGYYHPSTKKLKNGTYLIVGDTHGKHTKSNLFELLILLNKELKPTNVIHLGHMLDDDNTFNYWWKEFSNLIVLSKPEESSFLEDTVQNGYKFEIIRDRIIANNLIIQNQDIIQDYVKTSVKSFDINNSTDSFVINSHRHELYPICSYEDKRFVMSPGCLCNPHIIKTIKQIDFVSSGIKTIKQTHPHGYIKYRKMKMLSEFWEQGFIILEVKNDKVSFTHHRIIQKDDEFITSIGDKIYSNKGIFKPDTKIIVNADIHCNKQDDRILKLQDNFAKKYNADIYVNLGDLQNNASLNHHEMSKGCVIVESILEETKEVKQILELTSKWAKNNYLLYGNHERFIKDFYSKFPQLKELLDGLLNDVVNETGFKLIKHKDILSINNIKFMHGDFKMYGQSGDLLDKMVKTFGRNSIKGHSHYSAIRRGGYSVGASCILDQGYNEPNASTWNHGFAVCNVYKNIPFIILHHLL